MIPKEVVDADFLCIGGGIAGLMAAIRAAELGSKVVVAEKGNVLSSGAGGLGNDHFACYIPEVHGPDVMPLLKELGRGQIGDRMKEFDKVKMWYEHTFDIVRLWDKWGIPMKYNGRYEFAGHFFPGAKYPCHLKYSGKHQKTVLTGEAKKRGVKIINRVMVSDLVRDNEMYGAIGFHTRDGHLLEFHAKSVFLGTGTVTRLYQGLTPGWMFNATRPGTLTGDGRMMAYRAGAELINVERLEHHAGPKYFTRSGQATWVGVVRDPQGKAVGPYIDKPDKRFSDMIIEVNKGLFSEYAKSGKGPLYMDSRSISEEDHEYMMTWFYNEGFDAMTDHLREKGIDLRKHPIEWATYGMRGSGGSIRQDLNGQTSLKGLFVAGDETTMGISAASTIGWIAGAHAARWAKEADGHAAGRTPETLEEKRSFLDEMNRRESGPDWKEVNIALQQIMNDYAGNVRSETLLEAGLAHLGRLKEEARKTMVARNPHQSMRALEVLNLIDLGELICLAARERKETRGQHKRSDYPYTDPLLDKTLVLKNVDGRTVTGWI